MREEDSLQRCYQRALTAVGEDGLYRFLRKVFSGADHKQWFGDATCFPWRRVWTLNIDDAFERAYEVSRSNSHPPLASTAWNDPYIDDPSSLQVIHLHGKVDSEVTQPIVFSFSEYERKASDKVVWDQVLRSVFTTTPFVVVGSQIFGDPDMEATILNRSRRASSPSFVVNPSISQADEWELNKNGLIVIRLTAEDFFAQWAELCEFPERISDLFIDASLRLPQLQARLPSHEGAVERDHDIYAGDEPRWPDAISDRIADFQWMNEVIRQANDWLDCPDSRLIKVIGDRFSGVSSGLHYVAHEIAKAGVRTFWFDRSSRFNASDLVIHAQTNGPLLVVIESAADYADDIDEALRLSFELGNVGLLILVGETKRNVLRLDGRLAGTYIISNVEVPARLGRPDAKSLARKLFVNARAGRYETDNSPNRMVSDVTGNDVFSAMLDISGGSGFLSRMKAELSELLPWQRKLVLLLQVASSDQIAVSLTEASLALGLAADAISDGVSSSSSLGALVEEYDGTLRARQRDRALAETIATIGERESLEALTEMLGDLHPVVQRDSLRARNRAALLVGHSMSFRFLRDYFAHQELVDFYAALQSKYGSWNGRYWEQRALLYKSLSDWSRAESFAARAVTLFGGAYTRTTYGTILVNRASHYAQSNDPRWMDLYSRGKSELEDAQTESDEKFISQFAFLNATAELVSCLLDSGYAKGSSELAGVIEDWHASYAYLRIMISGFRGGTDAEERSERLSRKFQRITEGSAGSAGTTADSFVEGYDYGVTVSRRVGGGFIVEKPGVGRAVVEFRLQGRVTGGLPRRVPDLKNGTQITIRIVNSATKTPKAVFVRL